MILHFAEDLREVFSVAVDLAIKLNHRQINTCHILYGLFKADNLFDEYEIEESKFLKELELLIPAYKQPLTEKEVKNLDLINNVNLLACLEAGSKVASKAGDKLINSITLLLGIISVQNKPHIHLLHKFTSIIVLYDKIIKSEKGMKYGQKKRNKLVIV